MKKMNKLQAPHSVRIWLLLFVVSLASVVQAEDVTVTTYYPSPRGNYQTLNSTGNTNLATGGGGVSVNVGTATNNANLVINGTLQMTGGTPGVGEVLTSDAAGVATWTPTTSLTGIVTGSGTTDRIARWTPTGTQLGNSEIYQSAANNIGLGATPGAFKLDVVGSERIQGNLTLGSPLLTCAATEKLTATAGVVGCSAEGDGVVGNEVTSVTAALGLTGGGGPGAITLNVGAGTGITVGADTVSLTSPSLSCAPQAITNFNLGTGAVGCVATSGSVGTLTASTNITMSGPGVVGTVWTPGSGNATISATTSGGALPAGSVGNTLWNNGGTSWIVDSNIYNAGTNVGIGTASPRGVFDVLTNGNIYLVNDPIAGTGQTLYLPGHIYLAPLGGSNISYLQARRSNDSGSTELQLRTLNGGALTDAVRINSAGNVGIGTTSPDQKLVIQAGNLVVGNVSGVSPRIYFTDRRADMYMGINSWWMDFVGGVNEGFRWQNAGGTELMRLQAPTGNLGIGTPSPTAKLDIVGGHVLIEGNALLFNSSTFGSNGYIFQVAQNLEIVNSFPPTPIAKIGFGFGDPVVTPVMTLYGDQRISTYGPLEIATDKALVLGVGGSSNHQSVIYHTGLNDLIFWNKEGTGASDYIIFYFGTPAVQRMIIGGDGNVNITGNLSVSGTLTKGGGTFVIDHPLDPLNEVLRHSFVESPDMKNVYDGVIILDENGEAVVTLPSYFGALNKDFRYQLTPLGGSAPDLHVKEEVKDNYFVIAGGKPGQKVSWQVTGTRQDAYAKKHPVIVEEKKSDEGPYKKGEYIHPDAFTGE